MFSKILHWFQYKFALLSIQSKKTLTFGLCVFSGLCLVMCHLGK